MFEPTERPMFEWGRVDHALAGRKDFADSHRVSNREPEANARAPIIPVWRASKLLVNDECVMQLMLFKHSFRH